MTPSILFFLALFVWFIYAGFLRTISKHQRGTRSLRVSFLHPDLGIGGAENLIVNAAVALQTKGYEVYLFTSHHDPSHCFEETRGDGPLAKYVVVYGDWLPRTIHGRMYAACAFVRMVYITLRLAVAQWHTDIFLVDQVSLPVPLLRALWGRPVYFYGHYPDKLLCVDRSSILKSIYRLPLDKFEEWTTYASDAIVVNSKFTASVFQKTFSSLQSRQLNILYPPVNLADFKYPGDMTEESLQTIFTNECVFVSLNRYERKKNIALAIEAIVDLKKRLNPSAFTTVHLVIAGGYDPLNVENAQHLTELKSLALSSGVADQVTFLTSISNATKLQLLFRARAILYTPSFEHFGIVPVEAMACGTPIVAVNSGGPLESIVHQKTGYLCEPNGETWGQVLAKLQSNPELKTSMGIAGKERAQQLFSLEAFANTLDKDMQELVSEKTKTQ
ncbi:alpha-1,3-mannosyltransferase [Thraustotheca clavata]|uniref:Alpha-1,3/1,6-mannosyltransferase ALG2 n=1 Tax=Thraustotheca clavata TaxID=74557 RepID=A0A1W0A930_9STRA|nr:alpha-1,3-mannosyltransferase [Thraustotheca clavata]